MKCRLGFVSNSSSACFTVIPDEVILDPASGDILDVLEAAFRKEFPAGKVTLFMGGNCEFGWNWSSCHNLQSKWNWLVLQALCALRGDREDVDDNKATDRYIKKLDAMLLWIGMQINVPELTRLVASGRAWIDHQSMLPSRVFESVERIGIDRFLVDKRCYVQLGNDNELPPKKVLEGLRLDSYCRAIYGENDYEA
jgi:hypothetical protein